MIYSDFIQSEHSKRVWLHDSMTALGQFAFIAPIHRVKHWNQGSGKRTKCWAKEGDCIFCQRGIAKINEFTNGYTLKKTDNKVFVVEKYRPSLLDSEEQEWKWVVPEEIIDFLKDKDGDPMTLIDLFILLKDRFGGISEKDIKKYSIRLINNNVLDLRRAREKWI